MRIFIIFSTALSLFLFSCEKEFSYELSPDNGEKIDTSALDKFLTATKITDNRLKANLDSLIKRSRNHGWWNLCDAIYPLAGGSMASCKYNLKDPRDTDTAFRLSFFGNSWTFTSVSANPGTVGYGNTHFNPAIRLTDLNSCHISAYSMDNAAGGIDNADIGAFDGDANLGFYLSTRTDWPDSSGKPFAYVSENIFQGTKVNGAGYFLLTKTSGSASFYRNSSLIGTSSASSGNLPNLDLFICNQNFPWGGEPYPNGFSQRGLSFITIGSGIDSLTAFAMYSDIQDFVSRK